jgi:hypothetical protein
MGLEFFKKIKMAICDQLKPFSSSRRDQVVVSFEKDIPVFFVFLFSQERL